MNTAVRECEPTVNADVLPDALPLLTRTGLPRVVIPSLNCTVPPAIGVTVAVSATGAPGATGDTADVVRATVVVIVVLWRAGGAVLNASPTVVNATPPTTATTTAPDDISANGLFLSTIRLSCSDEGGLTVGT